MNDIIQYYRKWILCLGLWIRVNMWEYCVWACNRIKVPDWQTLGQGLYPAYRNLICHHFCCYGFKVLIACLFSFCVCVCVLSAEDQINVLMQPISTQRFSNRCSNRLHKSHRRKIKPIHVSTFSHTQESLSFKSFILNTIFTHINTQHKACTNFLIKLHRLQCFS